MSKAWRVVEYEAPDDAAGDAWLAWTLRASVNGTYRLPNGCRITACEAEGYSDIPDFAGLARARTVDWTLPVDVKIEVMS